MSPGPARAPPPAAPPAAKQPEAPKPQVRPGSWIIQVGALESEAEAKTRLNEARVICHFSHAGVDEIADIFSKGVKIEVGDMLPSKAYADRLKRVPKAWEKAFEVNASENEAVRASCMEFVLAGLYAGDKISRSTKHGRIQYEVE